MLEDYTCLHGCNFEINETNKTIKLDKPDTCTVNVNTLQFTFFWGGGVVVCVFFFAIFIQIYIFFMSDLCWYVTELCSLCFISYLCLHSVIVLILQNRSFFYRKGYLSFLSLKLDRNEHTRKHWGQNIRIFICYNCNKRWTKIPQWLNF